MKEKKVKETSQHSAFADDLLAYMESQPIVDPFERYAALTQRKIRRRVRLLIMVIILLTSLLLLILVYFIQI